MDIANQLIAIFSEIDDFCKEFNKHTQAYLLNGPAKSMSRCGLRLACLSVKPGKFKILSFLGILTSTLLSENKDLVYLNPVKMPPYLG